MSRAVSNEGGSLCPGPPQSGGQQSKGPITAVSIPQRVDVVSRTFPGGTAEAWGQTGDESWPGGPGLCTGRGPVTGGREGRGAGLHTERQAAKPIAAPSSGSEGCRSVRWPRELDRAKPGCRKASVPTQNWGRRRPGTGGQRHPARHPARRSPPPESILPSGEQAHLNKCVMSLYVIRLFGNSVWGLS